MCGELHIWEVMYHRTGSEAAGEDVGARGTPEYHDGTPQVTTMRPWDRDGFTPIGLSPWRYWAMLGSFLKLF